MQRASTKKRRKPLTLFLVPIALVAIGVVLLFTLGGGTSAIPIIGGGDDPVPEFDFRTRKAIAVPTAEEFDKVALAATATQVGDEITPVLDELFTNAFLDPSNWRKGDYEEVYAAFAPDALASAREGVETITLGGSAGSLFETVQPTKGSVEYRVLFNPDNQPDTAVVRYRFYASVERKDGTYLAIVAHGQLFLRDLDGWKITAFDMKRNDREGVAPVATGPSGGSGTTGATATTGATGSS